jgi:hypothetical protein
MIVTVVWWVLILASVVTELVARLLPRAIAPLARVGAPRQCPSPALRALGRVDLHRTPPLYPLHPAWALTDIFHHRL